MVPRDILKAIPLFGTALDDQAIDALLAGSVERKFPRGAVMLRQGDLGDSMFVITGGKASVSVRERSGEQEVATLSAGEIVGEMSLLTGARRSATVTARRAVDAIEITKPAMAAVLQASPELVHRFAETIEQRNAELKQIHSSSDRWNATGLSRNEIAARMTAFFSG
jgi:CRP-like cAMP-binding protein